MSNLLSFIGDYTPFPIFSETTSTQTANTPKKKSPKKSAAAHNAPRDAKGRFIPRRNGAAAASRLPVPISHYQVQTKAGTPKAPQKPLWDSGDSNYALADNYKKAKAAEEAAKKTKPQKLLPLWDSGDSNYALAENYKKAKAAEEAAKKTKPKGLLENLSGKISEGIKEITGEKTPETPKQNPGIKGYLEDLSHKDKPVTPEGVKPEGAKPEGGVTPEGGKKPKIKGYLEDLSHKDTPVTPEGVTTEGGKKPYIKPETTVKPAPAGGVTVEDVTPEGGKKPYVKPETTVRPAPEGGAIIEGVTPESGKKPYIKPETTVKPKETGFLSKLKNIAKGKKGKLGLILGALALVGAGAAYLYNKNNNKASDPAPASNPAPAQPAAEEPDTTETAENETPAAPVQTPPEETEEPAQENNEYTVKEGDNLWNIAKQQLIDAHKDEEGYIPSNKEIQELTEKLMELNDLDYVKPLPTDSRKRIVEIHDGDKIKTA